MNIADLMVHFQGQGSIFWVAALSIAAGATLLLVSGMVLARRGLVRGLVASGNRIPRPSIKLGRTRRSEPRPQVELTETGYKANVLAAAGPASAVSGPEMAELQGRLRKAANTLEEIHRSLINGDQMYGISALKAPGRDVDYVFKSGIG